MVSKDDSGLIGSIYFGGGRLRTIHSAGPALEMSPANEHVARCIYNRYPRNKWYVNGYANDT
jgi:hypothetical protein